MIYIHSFVAAKRNAELYNRHSVPTFCLPYDLWMSYHSIFNKSKMRYEICFDSPTLFETVTTVHELPEYLLKPPFQNFETHLRV